MWLKNKNTGLEFDIDDKELIERCLSSGDFEEMTTELPKEPAKSAPNKKKAGGK